jgi:ABC-type bacteriocin/lantibiotic exporter with double-glycine peptidase domain
LGKGLPLAARNYNYLVKIFTSDAKFLFFLNENDRNLLSKIFQILPRKSQTRLIQATIANVIISFLDLIGVLLIGAIGSLAVNGIRGAEQGSRVALLLNFLGMETLTLATQSFLLSSLALLLLSLRTFLSVVITRKTLHYLSRQGANITSDLFSRFMHSGLLVRNLRTPQETLFALTAGVSTAILNVVGSLVTIFADVFIACILLIGLFYIDPLTGFLTITLFGGLTLWLFISLKSKIVSLSRKEIDLSVSSGTSILGAIDLYHEIYVKNFQQQFTNSIYKERVQLASVTAEKIFLPSISKYVIESALLVGTIVIAAAQFLTQDVPQAVATMSIFLVSSSRIAPALLRIQQSSLVVRSSLAGSQPLTNLMSDLGKEISGREKLSKTGNEFFADIVLSKISYGFQDDDNFFNDINLEISGKKFVAFVGPSGAGKTTLVDIILGLRFPNSGEVTISGISPDDAIKSWPGYISYVPQNTVILNGTLVENITLDFGANEFNQENLEHALRISKLDKWVETLDNGVHSYLNHDGNNLSGGQRQRIGIARALYSRPKLVFFDEATSSLDAATEMEIADSISDLANEVSVILIAHRLSSIKKSDMVVYIDRGKIVAQGTFDEVRNLVPDFDHQAQLMGL